MDERLRAARCELVFVDYQTNTCNARVWRRIVRLVAILEAVRAQAEVA